MSLRGWLEIFSGRDVKLALELFEKAIKQDSSIEALLGKAKVYENR